MYIITTGLNPHDDYICHYGRKGMKWGEHIYSRDDIKRLKKFMRTDTAKEYASKYKTWEKEHYSKLGYKRGIFSNKLEKGSELSRYTSVKNEKPSKRMYAAINKSHDDKQYIDMAKSGNLGSKSKEQYKVVYTAESKLRVAKGRKVANDLIKKYGDKDLKEMWQMYKDLDVHNKSGYIFDVADEDYGKLSKTSSKEDIKNAEDMFYFKREVGIKVNELLYKNEDVKLYIDEKYRKKGYDAIEDAEDQMYGTSHPLIVYDPDKKLKKKSTRRIQ